MTMEEINKIFPPEYGGNAQISDLRLILRYIESISDFNGIEFYTVPNMAELYALDPESGDIAKVLNIGDGTSRTFIYDKDHWAIMVESSGGGGGPSPTFMQTTEKFNVSSVDEQAQDMALLNTPNTSQHLFVFLNGMYLTMGIDYTLTSNVIQFTGAHITAGDILTIKYSY